MDLPLIEDWFISLRFDESGTRCHPAITGRVFDHSSGSEHYVTTSALLYINCKDRVATTMNTVYRLGKPNPRYTEIAKLYSEHLSPEAGGKWVNDWSRLE